MHRQIASGEDAVDISSGLDGYCLAFSTTVWYNGTEQ